MARTYLKRIEVTCPNPDCPQREDAFEIRYEVEDDGSKKKIVGKKAYEDAEDAPRLILSAGTAQLKHPCPWCGVESVYRVPL